MPYFEFSFHPLITIDLVDNSVLHFLFKSLVWFLSPIWTLMDTSPKGMFEMLPRSQSHLCPSPAQNPSVATKRPQGQVQGLKMFPSSSSGSVTMFSYTARTIQAARRMKVANQLPLNGEMILDSAVGPVQSQGPKKWQEAAGE